MGTAHDRKSKSALLFSLHERSVVRASRGLGFPLDATELFCIGEDEIHVLIEREHLSGHLSAIVERHSHLVVDEVLHLALPVGRHDGRKVRTSATLARDTKE